MEVGRRLFHDGETPLPALVAAAAERVGLGELAAAATDEAHDEAIVASTDEAIRLGGPDVGSPILVVGEGTRGFHGPIVSPPPVGEDALRLWDAISTLTQIPGVYEVKHGREGDVQYGPHP